MSLHKKIDCYLNCQLTQEEIDELWVELILHDYLNYLNCMANLKMLKPDSASS